ncbi:hypothetical protein, partial [Bacillus amyloliquefaciens]|uniref:hypothetical protein n=1 Tax=Bacillus amyloliquefaciens TaxID=1390 RepID=UPI001CB94C65
LQRTTVQSNVIYLHDHTPFGLYCHIEGLIPTVSIHQLRIPLSPGAKYDKQRQTAYTRRF